MTTATDSASLQSSLFDFDLPESQIAQSPAQKRDESRLLVVDRRSGSISHRRFRELDEILGQPVALFRNNASVLKARLRGNRPTGGQVECLLLRPGEDQRTWWCLLKPGRRLPVCATFGMEGIYEASVLEKRQSGECLVAFEVSDGSSVVELSDKIGELPLPPYIQRTEPVEGDNERYQTVYADMKRKVAAASPTAGLHFTPELLQRLEERGHRFFDLTLHIGLGTFKPIQAENIEEHEMHKEFYEIPKETLQALHANSGRTLAIGTTTLRAIEHYSRTAGQSTPTGNWAHEADLFIYPPNAFHVDHLITNFHLPRSTLICLIAAYLTPNSTDGIGWLKEIYRQAIDEGYRFFSYGDAMLIL